MPFGPLTGGAVRNRGRPRRDRGAGLALPRSRRAGPTSSPAAPAGRSFFSRSRCCSRPPATCCASSTRSASSLPSVPGLDLATTVAIWALGLAALHPHPARSARPGRGLADRDGRDDRGSRNARSPSSRSGRCPGSVVAPPSAHLKLILYNVDGGREPRRPEPHPRARSRRARSAGRSSGCRRRS